MMKWIAAAALSLVALVGSAELRQAEVCGDGTYHQSSYCPAVLSSPSCSATGETTGSCSATSDESGGTRYVCATSNNISLSCDQIKACSGGAAVGGSSASETGSNSVALAGLTVDAAHYGQICNESPEEWNSNELVTASFTPSSSSEPYDLTAGGTRTIPFTHTWPTAPTITSTATVTPATLSANLVDGRELTLSAGSYGNVTVATTDQEIIIQSGVTIAQLTVSSTAQRIKIRGQTARVGDITGTIGVNQNAQDVLLDGLNQDATAISGGRNIIEGRRVAVINSLLQVEDFPLFSSTTGVQAENLIIANSQLIGVGTTQSGIRVQGIKELIMVDSNSQKINGNNLVLRVHASDPGKDVENVWVEGNQFEGGRPWFYPAPGTPDGEESDILNVYIRNNEFYYQDDTGLTLISVQDQAGSRPAYIHLTGNNAYGDPLIQYLQPTQILPAWDIEGDNTISAAVDPAPTWNFN